MSGFETLRMNARDPKPRRRGITEVRGPYYTVLGKRALADLLETAGAHTDALKFAGGSFAVMPRRAVTELIELCHQHQVEVSTGGFAEYVLTQGKEAFDDYVRKCKDYGFDIVEISAGFISIPIDDWLRMIELVQKNGMKAKAEIGIQFGAGGGTTAETLEASAGTLDIGHAVRQGKRALEAGAYLLMVESEGITESVRTWRTDVPGQLVSAFGTERLMFEAADPPVFSWYVKNFGPDVNLFVDHSQIVQLECLRRGIWGTSDLWGRVLTYR
jgi:phosphosulfolactate synthase (CoM biosynthesis protein A)